jgi:hypothetical protein
MSMGLVILIVVIALGALIAGLSIGCIFGFKAGYSQAMREAGVDYRAKRRIWLGRFMVPIGSLLLVVAFFASIYMWHFTHAALRARGTILEMRQSKDKDGDLAYAPTFRFQDTAGVLHIVSSSIYQNPPEFHVGDEVTVLYLADNPENAHIDSFWRIWGLPSLLGIVGGLTSIIGLILLYWPRIAGFFKRQQPQPLAI